MVSASLQAAHLIQPRDPGNLSVAARRLRRLKIASSLLCLYEDFIMFSLDFQGGGEGCLDLLPVLHDRAQFPSVGNKHLPHSRGFSLLPGKQPKGTFSIEHYSARLAFHLRKDSRRRCCFELVCPGKRTYEVGAGGRRGALVLFDRSLGAHGARPKALGGPAGLGRL